MTRKEAHAQGIAFLRQAFEAADQADASFLDGKTRDCIEARSGGIWLGSEAVVHALQSALKSAEDARCEDCDVPIAGCACAWSNKAVA